MAIPLPKLPPSFFHHPSPPPPKQPLSPLFPALASPTPALRPLKATNSPKTRLPSAAKDDSMSSIISEMEAEEEEEEEEEELLRRPLRHPDGIADRWREIHGSGHWAGLLDPMDPLLRSELIRYGEFAQACYDGFDYDPFSRYCGSCKYNRRKFFASLGMDDAGYEVTRYLYATSNINLSNFFTKAQGSKAWSEKANWIGYIAVSDDNAAALLGRRDIVIAWRGTVTRLEWVADLMDFLRPAAAEGIPCPDPKVKVESGFLDLYTDKDPTCRFCKYSARQQVLTEVRRLVEQHTKMGETVSITVTGHSLGSALAMLSAYDIAETGLDVGAVDGEKVAISVLSFSGPRVGNGRFKERFEELGVKALRVVNVHDTVPKVPGILFNERVPEFVRKFAEGLPWSYSHVGVELALDHQRSPFLKDTGDPSCFHNLEAHLHLLDGYAS